MCYLLLLCLLVTKDLVQGLPQKSRMQLEALRRLADHGRNYHEYRSRLKETAPPGVPFLGTWAVVGQGIQ
jgi:hypothetical protein